MIVSLLRTTEEGQVVLGEYRLEAGSKIFIHASKEAYGFMEEMLNQEIDGLKASEDPEAFLEALLGQFQGSMLSAIETTDEGAQN